MSTDFSADARPRVVVTGMGAVCASGRDPAAILDAVGSGQSAIGRIRSWDVSGWPVSSAAEIQGLELRGLVPDRKLLKLIRRTDVFGLYAATRAIEASGFTAWRDSLGEQEAVAASDRAGVYAGSGGGSYASQYDFFPLLSEAKGELTAFGRELAATVNPMWLLRTLPNNVLCHVGIAHRLKGANACITHHSVSGMLAIVEAVAALRAGEADRAVAIGHDAPIEPQYLLYYHRAGLVTPTTLRPFDASRDGSAFGEGAAALMLETETAARTRGASVVGEVLGSGYASEGEGLLAIRADGDGLARAVTQALDEAGVAARDVGMIVAHANGTPSSDASEAAALRRVFGRAAPPITGFKWAFGHLLAASGAIESVVALAALRAGIVPAIASTRSVDPAFADLPIATSPARPRSDVALVVSRGFGATDAALLLRSL